MRRTALVLLFVASACSEPGVQQSIVSGDPGPEREQISLAVFGEDVDPDLVLATVDDRPVLAGQLAVYLQLFPTLTVDDALGDLIDLRVVAALADEETPGLDIGVLDARMRARALAWIRAEVWENPALQDADPDHVRELVDDPGRRTLFGTPTLRRFSHVLVGPVVDEPDAATLDRAGVIAARIADRLNALGRRVHAADLLDAAAIDPEDPLMEGLGVVHDLHVEAPREYAGEIRWQGLPSVVPAFADALFETPIGELVGPVETDFGWHVILVEAERPAEMPDDGERQRIAEAYVLSRTRNRFVQERLATLMAQAHVGAYQENIGLLALEPEERVRAQAEQQRGAFER